MLLFLVYIVIHIISKPPNQIRVTDLFHTNPNFVSHINFNSSNSPVLFQILPNCMIYLQPFQLFRPSKIYSSFISNFCLQIRYFPSVSQMHIPHKSISHPSTYLTNRGRISDKVCERNLSKISLASFWCWTKPDLDKSII